MKRVHQPTVKSLQPKAAAEATRTTGRLIAVWTAVCHMPRGMCQGSTALERIEVARQGRRVESQGHSIEGDGTGSPGRGQKGAWKSTVARGF